MKISEKMIEDWICENPDCVCDMTILERQLPLSHGIADLLVFRHDNMRPTVIELKANPIKEKDIGQVMRYTYDVNKAITYLWSALAYQDGTTFELDRSIISLDAHLAVKISLNNFKSKSLRQEIFEDVICEEDTACCPMLIGPSIGLNTYAAARGAGAVVMIWTYDEDSKSFYFDVPSFELDRKSDQYIHELWTQRIVAQQILDMAKDAENRFETGIYQLMGITG